MGGGFRGWWSWPYLSVAMMTAETLDSLAGRREDAHVFIEERRTGNRAKRSLPDGRGSDVRYHLRVCGQ